MRAINLLPRDETRTRLEGKRTPLLIAAGAFVGVTLGAFVVGHSASSTAADSRGELATLQALVDRLPKAPNVNLGTIAQERADRAAALSAAISDRFAFDGLLRQIALVLPENTWLTGLQAAEPASTAGPTGSGSGAPASPAASTPTEDVTIAGSTYSQEDVARVLERLALVPGLADVRLASTASVEPLASGAAGTRTKSGRKVVTFVVEASLRTSGAS
jgi:Tfp pilus assembly protein PilN